METNHVDPYPIGSMYAIYANIGGILMVNVTIYSIHGSYGYGNWKPDSFFPVSSQHIPAIESLLVTSLWPATADFGSSLNPPRLIRRLGGTGRNLRGPPSGMGQNSSKLCTPCEHQNIWYCKWILFKNPPKYRQANKNPSPYGKTKPAIDP